MPPRARALSCCVVILAVVASGCGGPDDRTFGTLFQSLSTDLEIHYINVGWGSAVFVKGPGTAGKTVLMEAGNTGDGSGRVVPYLQSIGYSPSAGFDWTIAGHQHCDHIGGMDEVVQAGYDVRTANYYNGSNYASTCVDGWRASTQGTTAGLHVSAPVGGQLALGNGATLTFLARNGSIIGGGSVSVSDENDRSIAVLIKYGGFDYLWASDLGGGNVDEACTGRFTSSQTDVETSVINAISPGGASPMISAGGIDVLNVNHHGSESSTNKNWMNKSAPAVAVAAVGDGQTSGWDLPRVDVMEHVALAQATACITVPPAFLVQTEEGAPRGSLTSIAGYSVGNIKISTDGASSFTVDADGAVNQGPSELGPSGLPRTFALDDGGEPPPPPPDDTQAPTAPSNLTATGGKRKISLAWGASTDNVGVTGYQVWRAISAAGPFSLIATTTSLGYTNSGLTSGSTRHYQVMATDAAGNVSAPSNTASATAK